MKVDYIIVGQGLAGSLLAYRLWKAGKSIMVFDPAEEVTSTKIAAGMITPISGKRMTVTPMQAILYEDVFQLYPQIEADINETLLHHLPVQMSFGSIKEQNDFYSQKEKIEEFVQENQPLNKGLQAPYGHININKSGWLNTTNLINGIRTLLIENHAYIKHQVNWNEVKFADSYCQYLSYQANAIICCSGYQAQANPLFPKDVLIPNKGDVFIIQSNVITPEHIIKRGAYAVPISPSKQLFKVGSTYKWNTTNATPDELGYNDLKQKTDFFVNGEYEIKQHLAAIRPTTKNRLPILGRHHQHQNLFFFNGLGTKGVLLAPYYSRLMAELILNNKPLPGSFNLQINDSTKL
ncbi:MAG: FAD-binding oxidoreductase [Bacteroidia bacterium]|jgi:glycine/D-amino acid oxidase-like deaminating enzyme|nr:FAD-binding oxidoreductase [Bacteroidia bacterium]